MNRNTGGESKRKQSERKAKAAGLVVGGQFMAPPTPKANGPTPKGMLSLLLSPWREEIGG